jgi:hypothetical protein
MLTPGFFAASIGVLVGQTFWLRRQPGDRTRMMESLDAYPAISFLRSP